jgi:hypothetical protein
LRRLLISVLPPSALRRLQADPGLVAPLGAIGARRIRRRHPRSGCSKSVVVDFVAHLAIELMERYALKEVSEVEKRRVEKHVASCPKCEYFLEEQIGWVAAMRSPFKRMVERMIEDVRKRAAQK